MRAVIDTNVLVSGVLNPHGPPGRIVDGILAQSFVLLYDDRILAEYRDVLSRPVFEFRRIEVDAFVDFAEATGESVMAASLAVLLPDPDDLPFLEVATAADADALVTGNLRHFKPRRGSHGINVCTPAEFLRRLGGT